MVDLYFSETATDSKNLIGEFATNDLALTAAQDHAKKHKCFREILAVDVEDDGIDMAVHIGGYIRTYYTI